MYLHKSDLINLRVAAQNTRGYFYTYDGRSAQHKIVHGQKP